MVSQVSEDKGRIGLLHVGGNPKDWLVAMRSEYQGYCCGHPYLGRSTLQVLGALDEPKMFRKDAAK